MLIIRENRRVNVKCDAPTCFSA